MAGYRKLPSGLWQATVRLPDGQRRTRTDPLKGVVKKWAEDFESAMRRGEWADPQAGSITLGEWYAKWSATRAVEVATERKNASHWRSHVQPRWSGVALKAVTPWDAEAWIATMSKGKVGATAAAQSVRLLKQLMAEAARHRLVAVDPLASVEVPSIPGHVDRFLTWPELDALVAALPNDRDRAIVELGALCGLRHGEAIGLHAHRVDFGRQRLMVQETIRRNLTVKDRPKSDAGQRLVPMPERMMDRLRPFVTGGLLFPGVDYTNWRRRVFVPAVIDAGLAEPLPTFHDLRHSYGSWLADAGVPPTDIMSLMGHSTLRATERYIHSGPARFTRAIAALAPAPTINA